MATPVHYLSLPTQGDSIFDMGRADRRRPLSSAGREEDVARQFEALMLQQWLKQARQASGGDALFDSEQTRFAQSLGDEQMALQLSQPGLGLAQALLAQIREGQGVQQMASTELPLRTSRRSELRSHVGQSETGEAVAGSFERRVGKLLSSVSRAGAALLSAVSGAPGHIERFVTKMAPAAQKVADETGLPAALILSQAALESGWGKREILHDDGSTSHNLFGIKATASWKGKVADVMTTEYVAGQAQKQVASFRAYDSYHDSFRDYARLLGSSDRYQAVREAATAEQAAFRVQEAGYATDPQYAEKLLTIMRYFEVRSSAESLRANAGTASTHPDSQA